MTGTPIPADSERLARGGNWHGPLTVENAEAVRDRIEQMLKGQRYSYASVYVAPAGYARQSLRTGQAAEKFTCTITEPGEGRKMAMITVPDSYGLWYLDTTVQTRLQANVMDHGKMLTDGAYIVFERDQIRVETRNYEGATIYTTIAPERDYSLVTAAQGVLKAWDESAYVDDSASGDLVQEIRWLRDALRNGE